MNKEKRKGSLLVYAVLAAGLAAVGVDTSYAKQQTGAGKTQQNAQQQVQQQDEPTLKDTQKTVAANRKSKGHMQSTTNDDRWSAAQRHKDRHAAEVAKKKGEGK